MIVWRRCTDTAAWILAAIVKFLRLCARAVRSVAYQVQKVRTFLLQLAAGALVVAALWSWFGWEAAAVAAAVLLVVADSLFDPPPDVTPD